MLEHPVHLLRRKVWSGDNQQERLSSNRKNPQRLYVGPRIRICDAEEDRVRTAWRHADCNRNICSALYRVVTTSSEIPCRVVDITTYQSRFGAPVHGMLARIS